MLKVFITAGEASGDVLGARLMAALRHATGGQVVFTGVGGAQMAAEDLRSLFPMTDLSVMGISEVLPRLPKILRRIRQTAAAVAAERPDIFISIDSPDFSFRVAKIIRASAVRPRMVHYVAPTVWAWRPERAAKVAGLYDGILCLLPFEPPYFEREGMKAAFVGHAMMESDLVRADGAAFRARYGIPADAAVMGVMFGSRMGELNRMGPVLRASFLPLAKEDGGMHIVAPTLPHLAREVQNYMFKQPCTFHIIDDPVEKAQAFRAMDFAVATSGTVGLELAVADVPHVIGYRLSNLTAAMVKRKLTVKYAHLANILLDDGVVPEFLQEKCVAADITPVLRLLKSGGLQAERQRQSFEKVRGMIAGPNGQSPSAQAARFVMDIADAALPSPVKDAKRV